MNFIVKCVLYVLTIFNSDAVELLRDFVKNPIFSNVYGQLDANIRVGDAGEPLILTDLVEQDRIEEAKAASRIDPPILGVESYTGYFTVDKIYNSNLFFWFFPSQSNYEEDPLILWLQGGPGSTSMFGLFEENGPYVFTGENELTLRNISWTKSNSVVYIDQPAGTGWSFTNKGYAQNETKIGDDLYEALIQFFTLFPELQTKEFFIAGESYSGKYIPVISLIIHQRNPTANVKIPLKGFAIGNGMTDPKYQYKYSEYVYQHGLIDFKTRNIMKAEEDKAIDFINQKQYKKAFVSLYKIYDILSKADGLDFYNYLTLSRDYSQDDYMSKYFQREDVRKALHVGNTKFDDVEVIVNLEEDLPVSQADAVAELLNHYRVLIYNGQLDILCAYPMTIEYLRNLKFNSADEYAKAKRQIWYDGNVVAGYVKKAGNLTEVLVRNAGHMVTMDQPEWALTLVNKFIKNQPIV